MKIRLSSMVVGGVWRISKQLFQNDHKLFVAAYDEHNFNNEMNFLLMPYDENVEQLLIRVMHQISKTQKQTHSMKLLVPAKPIVETLNKTKLLALAIPEKPLSLHLIMNAKGYNFTPLQIIEAAISGIWSLSELHSLNIVHAQINPKSCYFYNRKKRIKSFKTQIVTYFGVCVVDAEKFTTKLPTSQNRVNDLIYEPCAKALGLKPGFKDDIQSLLYVLIRMATNHTIFANQRYHKQWKTEENVRKWKLTELYFEIVKHIPPSLSFLVQLYLHLQQLTIADKIDYSLILKKLRKEKEYLLSRELSLVTDNIELDWNLNSNLDPKKESNREKDDSSESIFEEDIKISIRNQETGLDGVKIFED